jgi:hypothetical protein
MAHYYSDTLKGFVNDELMPNLPEDAIAVTDEQWLAFMEGIAEGQTMTIKNGKPALVARVIKADWASVRRKRTALLTACDWTQLADCQLSDQEKTAWTAYRQALRDIPEDFGDPNNVSWPAKPA